MGLLIPAQGAVIDCRDVTVVKGGQAVVSDVTWSVGPADRWVIIGPNGAGKSSLLDIVSARAHPTRGDVVLLGEQLGLVDVFSLRARIGLVSSAVAIDGAERVADVVLTSVYGMTGHWREAYDDSDRQRAQRLLRRVGIAELADRRFGTLSDGERKRALLARALMPDPELLVLDEPAAGLDLGAREQLVTLLGDLARDAAAPAIVLVTHHVEEVPAGFTHGMLLRGGRIVAAGPLGDVITGGQLSRTFDVPVTVGRFADRYVAITVRH